MVLIQINTLIDIQLLLNGSDPNKYFTIKNGYTESTEEQLKELNKRLMKPLLKKQILNKLRIGIHSNTSVTFKTRFIEPNQDETQLVSQAYCSAISVSYSGITANLWEPFASLILQASYEATLWAGVIPANFT